MFDTTNVIDFKSKLCEKITESYSNYGKYGAFFAAAIDDFYNNLSTYNIDTQEQYITFEKKLKEFSIALRYWCKYDNIDIKLISDIDIEITIESDDNDKNFIRLKNVMMNEYNKSHDHNKAHIAAGFKKLQKKSAMKNTKIKKSKKKAKSKC